MKSFLKSACLVGLWDENQDFNVANKICLECSYFCGYYSNTDKIIY